MFWTYRHMPMHGRQTIDPAARRRDLHFGLETETTEISRARMASQCHTPIEIQERRLASWIRAMHRETIHAAIPERLFAKAGALRDDLRLLDIDASVLRIFQGLPSRFGHMRYIDNDGTLYYPQHIV